MSNPVIEGHTLARLVGIEAMRLHIVPRVAHVRSDFQPATSAYRISINSEALIDVTDNLARELGLMEVDRARGVISDMLCAQAYPNGL